MSEIGSVKQVAFDSRLAAACDNGGQILRQMGKKLVDGIELGGGRK